MPEATVIVNPTAGRGAGQRLAPQIAVKLRTGGLDFEMLNTEAPKHATELAKEAAARGCKVVAVVGGDGTFNEVLNGLVGAVRGADGPALGIVPIGTGNDFAYGAGLSLDLDEACRVVARGQSRVIDVGWTQADTGEGLYFGNGVGFGFDAIANIESRKLQRLRGTLVYVVAVLRTLAFYYQAPMVEVTFGDQTIRQPTLMLSIMNGRRFGGAFNVSPEAQVDNGQFDLCVTDQVSRGKMVRFVPRFMRGTHVTDHNFSMYPATEIKVVSEEPWAGHADGEIIGVGAKRIEVVLLPRRLRLLC